MGSRKVVPDLVDRFLGGGTADRGQRSGAQAFRDMGSQLDQPRCLRHGESLGIGVGDDEFRPLQIFRNHVVDRVAATTADADNGYLRPHFRDDGPCRGAHRLVSLELIDKRFIPERAV
jgi:hypothetical protein